MVYDWEIRDAESESLPKRKVLFIKAEKGDILKFKEKFYLFSGSFVKLDDAYRCFLYNLTPEIEEKIKRFLKGEEIEEKVEEEIKEKKEIVIEGLPEEEEREEVKIEIGKFGEEERRERRKKEVKKIRVTYILPAGKEDLLDKVEEGIKNVILEKDLKYEFEKILILKQDARITPQELATRAKDSDCDVVIIVAPENWGKEVVSILRSLSVPFQIITEDNVDKKFRYLNLITEIALLSTRK
ncbi:MAG: hypothetical protein DRI22_00955 [Caldiserica bacterium]|nr:MAG: hypothetical protein DRI22_00955 [Caldisericota bacterium]